MIQRDYLIIGSGIGGASACEGIRKYDKRGSVTLIGAEVAHPYKRWMLSKAFLRERTAPIKKLTLFEPHWYDAHKIETRLGTIVTQLNTNDGWLCSEMGRLLSSIRRAWPWAAARSAHRLQASISGT